MIHVGWAKLQKSVKVRHNMMQITSVLAAAIVLINSNIYNWQSEKRGLIHVYETNIPTVFPRNLAAVRFYFKAQFGAATIQGRLDFEGGVYTDWHACVCTASIISLHVFVCTHNACAHMYWLAILYHAARFWGQRLLGWVRRNMQRYSRAAGFRGAARFRGNAVCRNLSQQCRGAYTWNSMVN